MSGKATEKALHVRLLEGFDVKSRDDGSVHTVKNSDGKVVAEVCVGKVEDQDELQGHPEAGEGDRARGT